MVGMTQLSVLEQCLEEKFVPWYALDGTDEICFNVSAFRHRVRERCSKVLLIHAVVKLVLCKVAQYVECKLMVHGISSV